MHFGALVRDVLSRSCGSDLRAARARTVVPALRSPETQQVLAANIARVFGVAIPAADLDRMTTVRDVLQCVRLRRWIAGVEDGTRVSPSSDAIAAASGDRQGVFRFTRRKTTERPMIDPAAMPIKRPRL